MEKYIYNIIHQIYQNLSYKFSMKHSNHNSHFHNPFTCLLALCPNPTTSNTCIDHNVSYITKFQSDFICCNHCFEVVTKVWKTMNVSWKQSWKLGFSPTHELIMAFQTKSCNFNEGIGHSFKRDVATLIWVYNKILHRDNKVFFLTWKKGVTCFQVELVETIH
jgi:hypothetical protein